MRGVTDGNRSPQLMHSNSPLVAVWANVTELDGVADVVL